MNNNSDKKFIFMLIFMILIVGVTYYILKKQENENISKIQEAQNDVTKIIEAKRRKIESLIGEMDQMFSAKTFGEYTGGLRSYVDIPIEVGRVRNDAPFGNYSAE